MNVVDMLRTFVTVVILVKMRNYSGLEIILLILVSVSKQVYIIQARPFSSRLENGISLFNELLISLYIYGIILLTNYNNSTELRVQASFLLIGIIGVYTLVNVGTFILIALMFIWRHLKRKCIIAFN